MTSENVKQMVASHHEAKAQEAALKEKAQEFRKLPVKDQLVAKKQPTCPVCAARRRAEEAVSKLNDQLYNIIKFNSIPSMKSCILCVQKHIGRASVYYDELLSAKGSGTTDGTASIDVKTNHLKILGHLGCAIEESMDYPSLNALLVEQERQYRYNGYAPDWDAITKEIIKAENSQKS